MGGENLPNPSLLREFLIESGHQSSRYNSLPHIILDRFPTGNFEMRLLDYFPTILLTTFDNNEALIVAEADSGLTESPALWTNNSSLVTALQEYFETLWLKAIQKNDPTLTSPL